MKSVLMSIQPKWCKLIAEGKKTVEVRKTKPKLDVPFKCYIYMTKDKPRFEQSSFSEELSNGKVIGEFVCDKVYDLKFVPKEYYAKPAGTFEQFICENSCLSFDDIKAYGKGKNCYAWHITDLVIYDNPKELGEFKPYNRDCKYSHLGYAIPECKYCHGCQVTRPPMSWMFIEELGV